MEVALHELGEIFTGNTPSKKNKNYWNSEDTVFIKPNDLNNNNLLLNDKNNEYISKEALAQARIVGRNSILVTCIGTIGKIAITTDAKTAFNQQINAIVPNKNVYTKYLAYALMHYKPRLAALANAPVVPIINKKQFSNFKINLNLDKEIQYTVIRQLDLVGEIIKNKNRQLSKLDELIKARFVEMFGDPVNNSKDQPVDKFINIVKLQRGFDLPVKKRDSTGKIPVFGSNGIVGYHTEAKAKNGIITGRSGTIGKVYRKSGEYWPLNTSLFSVDTHGNNIIFLQVLMQLFHLERFYNGAGVPTLNRNDVHRQKIIKISLDKQNEFANFVQQVDKSKVAVQKSLDETQRLFDSLMQEYFG